MKTKMGRPLRDQAKIDRFAKNLRTLMEVHKVDQTRLSRNTGIPQGTLSNYMNARQYPGREKLQILADYFKTSVEALTD